MSPWSSNLVSLRSETPEVWLLLFTFFAKLVWINFYAFAPVNCVHGVGMVRLSQLYWGLFWFLIWRCDSSSSSICQCRCACLVLPLHAP